jgi:hypothetical protein
MKHPSLRVFHFHDSRKNYTKSFPMKPLELVKDTIFAGVRITYDPDEAG